MLAPQLGHRVAPAGIAAPQFLQFIAIPPAGAPIAPIGMDPMGWPGIMPGAICGLKTIPRIPAIKLRMKPMMNPPKEDVAKLTNDSTRMITPHMVWDEGLEYIIIPPSMMIIPKTMPRIPRMPIVVPTPTAAEPPVVVLPIVEINDPRKAWKAPPPNTANPPRIESTIAAVGFSPKGRSSQGYLYNI